jgi:hypothetical protein
VVTDYLLRRTHNLQIARSLQAGQAYDQIVHEHRRYQAGDGEGPAGGDQPARRSSRKKASPRRRKMIS